MQPAEEVVNLVDIGDDCLISVAATLLDAPSLLSFAATCKLLHNLILTQAASSVLVWSPLIASDFAWPARERASPRLYRALSCVQRFRWHECDIETSRNRLLTLNGRSSSAGCCFEGEMLMYGGTLNGNAGPLLGDLLALSLDKINYVLTVKLAKYSDSSDEVDPGPRRGHSFTATSAHGSASHEGTPVVCLLSGWGHDENNMAPYLLTKEDDGYRWTKPLVSGAEPEGRAFHSATEICRGRLCIVGGLGSGCCRTDVALLDLNTMCWSVPRVGGQPCCLGGRAGHGAAFFPARGAAARAAGDGSLILVSGAMRSALGDSHQASIDVLEIGRNDVEHAGSTAGTLAAAEDSAPTDDEAGEAAADVSGKGEEAPLPDDSPTADAPTFRWSEDDAWRSAQLPGVRTASYASFARSLVAWSGIREGHAPAEDMHVIDVQRKRVREATALLSGVEDDLQSPEPRGGALLLPVPDAPHLALLLCGSDHEDDSDMITPFVLELILSES